MSSNADWQQIKEIFSSALDLDPDKRDAFVRDACKGNNLLRQEVRSWLASYSELEDFIETPAFEIEKVFANVSSSGPQHFGNYTIIQEIGHGGMGAVFLAERNDGEFLQQVAIKIIRQAIAESELINRFKRERQILASLNHPNIARLLDGGISDDGLPFLAMEFVDGESITTFVYNNSLNLEERLKLFLKVCGAVTYAHRNLIVHRDLKPSNILVTSDGEPKLLDFGLAKLMDENIASDSAQTQTAFRALTPAYASPEQLRNEPITTASDIYSLGVVLYELLTGERPFRFEGKDLVEIIKTVSEHEPHLPSSNQRSAIRTHQLKGDLDNIILTALRKEPERRYQSVAALADDIERYLQGLPVNARRSTFRYRTGKFVRRHRLAVAAASFVILSLIAATFVSLWQARVAQREQAKADTVNRFLQDVLKYSDNSTGLAFRDGRETTVKDVLNEAAKRLETGELSNYSDVNAELHRIIGASYLTQGNYEPAKKHLSRALALQTQIYGENSLETLPTLVELGAVLLVLADYENAEKIYDERLSILRREYQSGSFEPAYLLVALNDYAVLRRAQGDNDAAEALLREGLALSPQLRPEQQIAVGISESVLALVFADRGNFDEAERIVRGRLAEIRKSSNQETLDLATNLNALGSFLVEKSVDQEAMQNLQEAEQLYRKLTHPHFLPLADNLRFQARLLYSRGNFDEAEIRIDESLEIYRESSLPQHINFPAELIVKGMILNSTGRTIEAEKLLREAVELREKYLPSTHFMTAIAKGSLGECLVTQKRFSEAEPLLFDSYESLKRSQGEQNPRTESARERLINFYTAWNKTELAARFASSAAVVH